MTCRASTSRRRCRAEHPPVRRRPAGQQRAADRRARHRQMLARSRRCLNKFATRGPAPDRGGQARSRRPARDRRPGRRARRSGSSSFATTCRSRPRRRATRRSRSCSTARSRRPVRQRPDLRDLQPAPPDAGVHAARTSSTSTSARRSIRARRSEEKISLSERFGAVGLVLSVRPGRVSRHRRALADGTSARAGRRRGGAHARRCSGRSSAVRAADGSRGSSRATTRAGRKRHAAGRRGRVTRAIDVAAAILIAPRTGRVLLAQRPAGKAYRGLLGVSRRQVRARRRRRAEALARELHEELGIDVEAPAPWLTRVTSIRTRTCGCISSGSRVVGRAARREGQALRVAAPGRARRRADAAGERAGIPRRSRCRPSTRSPTPRELGEAPFLARSAARLAAGLRLVQLREKTMPRDRLAATVRAKSWRSCAAPAAPCS